MKQSRGAKRAALRLLSRWMAREVRDARRRWAEGLQRGRTWLMVPVTVASMYVLWHWAFGLGFYFGVSFLIAATLTLLRGHIFTHPFRLFLVAVAVVIGTLIIPSLSGDAWQAFRRGDTLTALVLVATSSLFVVTQSFWLCCFLHLGIRVILLWNQPTQQPAM